MEKLTLKDLYQISKNALGDISPLENSDFRLEQAEYDRKEQYWDVVVSYLVKNINKPIRPLAPLTPEYQFFRIYKRVKISNDKEVLGFYIFNKED